MCLCTSRCESDNFCKSWVRFELFIFFGRGPGAGNQFKPNCPQRLAPPTSMSGRGRRSAPSLPASDRLHAIGQDLGQRPCAGGFVKAAKESSDWAFEGNKHGTTSALPITADQILAEVTIRLISARAVSKPRCATGERFSPKPSSTAGITPQSAKPHFTRLLQCYQHQYHALALR